MPTFISEAMNEAARIGPIPKTLLAATDTSLGPEAAAIDAAAHGGGRDD